MAMVTPFLATKLGQEALSAGVSGFTGGLGQVVGATTVFDKGDRRQLAYEQEQQRRGAGATQAERSRIRSQAAQQRGGQMATQSMQASDNAAMLANAGMLSGRDIFQQEYAAQEAERVAREAEGQALREADEMARARRQQRIMEMEARERQRKAMMRTGLTQMGLSTALGIGLPFLEKGINTRRARLAGQAETTALRGAANPTPAMSTPRGNYRAYMSGDRGTGFDNVPDQVDVNTQYQQKILR
jgi:hypothetical protein